MAGLRPSQAQLKKLGSPGTHWPVPTQGPQCRGHNSQICCANGSWALPAAAHPRPSKGKPQLAGHSSTPPPAEHPVQGSPSYTALHSAAAMQRTQVHRTVGSDGGAHAAAAAGLTLHIQRLDDWRAREQRSGMRAQSKGERRDAYNSHSES